MCEGRGPQDDSGKYRNHCDNCPGLASVLVTTMKLMAPTVTNTTLQDSRVFLVSVRRTVEDSLVAIPLAKITKRQLSISFRLS